jgi:hypothetical protein
MLLKFEGELKNIGVQLNMLEKIEHFIIGKIISQIIEMLKDSKKLSILIKNIMKKNKKLLLLIFLI